MRKDIFPILYSFILGFSILGIWIFLIYTDQVSEFPQESYKIIFHIIAEMATGITLIASGLLLLFKHRQAYFIFIFSLGCVSYTLVASSGYYLQNNELIMVVTFGLILIITFILLIKCNRIFRKSRIQNNLE